MSKELTKIFITKYALTGGIIEATAEIKNGRAYCLLPGAAYQQGFNPNEYALTRGESNEIAQALREKRIKSLEKQIEKLKTLKFQ